MEYILLEEPRGKKNNIFHNLLKKATSENTTIYDIAQNYGGDYHYYYISFENSEQASLFTLKFS